MHTGMFYFRLTRGVNFLIKFGILFLVFNTLLRYLVYQYAKYVTIMFHFMIMQTLSSLSKCSKISIPLLPKCFDFSFSSLAKFQITSIWTLIHRACIIPPSTDFFHNVIKFVVSSDFKRYCC